MSALKRIRKELAKFNDEPLDGTNIFQKDESDFFHFTSIVLMKKAFFI